MAELIPAISGFVGVLVGGLLTAWIEGLKYKRQVRDEARRRKIEDLHLLQDRVDEVVDAIGHDSGELDQLRRAGENLANWHPWQTYHALRQAEKRAVWVTDSHLKQKWEQIRLDTRSAQALVITTRNDAMQGESEDQWTEMITLRTFELVKASTDKYTEFRAVLEKVDGWARPG